MADFISREAAIKAAKCHYPKANEMIAGIILVPAADVVEVVRCKDCKYYTEGKLLGPTKFCYFYKIGTGLNTADDDFCSKGERED